LQWCDVPRVSKGLYSKMKHNIRKSQKGVRGSIRKISTGKRVEKSSDDAAAQAVSSNLNAVKRSKDMAIRNINDGISLLQTADSGVNEITEILQRLRELAVQSGNDTLSDTDRGFADKEYQELLDGITSTARNNKFNGNNLLSFQYIDVGLVVDVSSTMSGEISEVQSAIGDFAATFRENSLNVAIGLAEMGNGGSSGGVTNGDSKDSLRLLSDIGDSDFDDNLNDLEAIGQSMDPYTALLDAAGITDTGGDGDGFTFRSDPEKKMLVVITDTGRETDVVTTTTESATTVGQLLAAQDVEVRAIRDPDADGDSVDGSTDIWDTLATETDGEAYDIGDASGQPAGGVGGIAVALQAIANEIANEYGADPLEIQVGDGSSSEDRINLGMPLDLTSFGLSLTGTDITSSEDAMDALDAIDAALDQVLEERATLGARQNRLVSAMENQISSSLSYSQANSQMVDVDIAVETSELTASQIMLDAGQATLAQARDIQFATMKGLLG
jgi:flagellin